MKTHKKFYTVFAVIIDELRFWFKKNVRFTEQSNIAIYAEAG